MRGTTAKEYCRWIQIEKQCVFRNFETPLVSLARSPLAASKSHDIHALCFAVCNVDSRSRL